ncbi:MAG: hypothetical protein CMP10_01265 [Zetaproteobacteria bacterium]|nr:hypothetical protein [Pseudobdellovibrionaceae bacterium]
MMKWTILTILIFSGSLFAQGTETKTPSKLQTADRNAEKGKNVGKKVKKAKKKKSAKKSKKKSVKQKEWVMNKQLYIETIIQVYEKGLKAEPENVSLRSRLIKFLLAYDRSAEALVQVKELETKVKPDDDPLGVSAQIAQWKEEINSKESASGGK